MKSLLSVSCILFAIAILVTACAPQPTPTSAVTSQTIANPASENCVKQGGTVEIRTETNGEVGYCIFTDSSECEEWAFLRGECMPGQTTAVAMPEPSEDILARAAKLKPLDMSYSVLLPGLSDWEQAVLDKMNQVLERKKDMNQSLPSWNDTGPKAAILNFIQAVSDPASASFVPPLARIATFDNDGTLWLEKPLYIQLQHGIHAIAKMAAEKPEVRDRQPFKAVYEKDRAWLGQVVADFTKVTCTGS